MRGYLYHIFPVEFNKKSEEATAVANDWRWKYFEWLFFAIKDILEFMCMLSNVEPVFTIYIPKKHKK